MVRTTVEIAAEIEELKQHLEGTATEFEERLEPIRRRAHWLARHRRTLGIAAAVALGALVVARTASRLR